MEIPTSRRGDPKGLRLAAVLNAERRAEDWTARGIFMGWIVIVVSLPTACLMFRGVEIESSEGRFLLALWILALASLGACVVARARARRHVNGLLERAGGRRIQIDD